MSDGRTLFCRGAEDPAEHDEIWDDSALVEEFNRALDSARAELGLTGGRGRSPPQKPARSARAWRPGDFCVAEYAADGLPYEAEVLAVDERGCRLRFVGYGNEQRAAPAELRPSGGKKARQRQKRQAREEQEQEEQEEEQEQEGEQEAAADGAEAAPAPPAGAWPPFAGWGPPQGGWGPPQGDWGPPQGSWGPPQWGLGPPQGSWGPPRSGPRLPPPPPPPPLAGSDPESLANMLMSWYISGYYTGYYQARQEGRPGGK